MRERELGKSRDCSHSLSAYGLTLSFTICPFFLEPSRKQRLTRRGSEGCSSSALPSFCVCLALMSLTSNPLRPLFWLDPPLPPLHAVLLSRQHFNKQSPRNKMLLNGCILLAVSEQAVYRGACQLLPLGCCSMWKQWRESAFDASPTWFSHSVLLFSLWWSSVKCSSATGGRHINTHTGEEGRRTHTVNSLELAAHISVHTINTPGFFFPPNRSVVNSLPYVSCCFIDTFSIFYVSIHVWCETWKDLGGIIDYILPQNRINIKNLVISVRLKCPLHTFYTQCMSIMLDFFFFRPLKALSFDLKEEPLSFIKSGAHLQPFKDLIICKQ